METPLGMAAAIPLVRAGALHLPIRFLERIGAPVERLLERSRLPVRTTEDPELLVPFAAATHFMEDAARGEGVEDFGFRIAAPMHVVGRFGRQLYHAATLAGALETAYRTWSGYNTGVHAWLTRHGEVVRLHHRFTAGSDDDRRQWVAGVLAQYLGFLAAVAGPAWRPLAVGVSCGSLPGVRAHPVLANTPLELGQPWTTITIPARLLERPPPAPTAGAAADWPSLPADDVGGAVRQVVVSLLADGYPDIRLVAEAVGMSARTLQRRLREEQLTFAGVVATARCSEARRLLGDPARKIIDVALDLGYSDPAHFTRAFERWTGMAPRSYRQHVMHGNVTGEQRGSTPDA